MQPGASVSSSGDSSPGERPNADVVSAAAGQGRAASLDRICDHYSSSFARTAGRSEAVIVAWAGSLALFFVVALLPLQETTSRITRAQEKLAEANAAQARNAERRSQRAGSELAFLLPEIGAVVDQLVSLDIRRGRPEAKPGDDQLRATLEERLAMLLVENEDDRDIVAELRPRELNRRLLLLRQAAEIRERRSRDSADLVALRRQVTETPTPIGNVRISALLVPTVWLVLAGGLITYLSLRRRALLAILGRWIVSARQNHSDTEGLVTDAPFWLSPLPARIAVSTAGEVTREDVARFIGRSASESWQRVALGFCAAGAVGLFAWVAWITFTVGTYYTDPHTGFRVTAVGLLAALTCWSAALAWWFAPFAPVKASPEGLSRRQWLGIAATAAGGAYLLAPRGMLPAWATFNARRSRRDPAALKHPPEIAGVFSMSTTSGIVHFVSATGVHPDGAALNSSLLVKLDDAAVRTLIVDPAAGRVPLQDWLTAIRERRIRQRREPGSDTALATSIAVPTPRLAMSQCAAALETAALDALRQNRIDDAVTIVRAGLPVDDRYRRRSGRNPSYRLYDLWARCVLERRDAAGLRALAEHIRTTWPTDSVLRDRVVHWERRMAETPLLRRTEWPEAYRSSRRFAGMWRGPTTEPLATQAAGSKLRGAGVF